MPKFDISNFSIFVPYWLFFIMYNFQTKYSPNTKQHQGEARVPASRVGEKVKQGGGGCGENTLPCHHQVNWGFLELQ